MLLNSFKMELRSSEIFRRLGTMYMKLFIDIKLKCDSMFAKKNTKYVYRNN